MHRTWVSGQHRRVLRALAQCRTAALGGHRDRCEQCAQPALSDNSCRDRHCPKCLTAARNAWVAARERELLPVGYVHIVFTMPEPLARLALRNKRVVYDRLFQAAAGTLLEVAANPKRLGGDVGGLMVRHTWGQRLQHHPHVHCVVPAGGLSPDHTQWIHARPRFFLPNSGAAAGLSRQAHRRRTRGLSAGASVASCELPTSSSASTEVDHLEAPSAANTARARHNQTTLALRSSANPKSERSSMPA